MDIQLTDREADIMQVLWNDGPLLVAEVRERLKDQLAYTTVLTMLRILETKGYVGHQEEGRGHRYFPLVRQQAAQDSALRHITRKLFEGSAELLLTRLVADQGLRPEALERMRRLLDAHARVHGEEQEGEG
jgi:predicted transcriptional regulator